MQSALGFWSAGGSYAARAELPNVMLLNGQWSFHLAASPQDVPAGFFHGGFDAGG